jgi:hypothetical protein
MQPTQNGHRFPIRAHRRAPLDPAYVLEVRIQEVVALAKDLVSLAVRDLPHQPTLTGETTTAIQALYREAQHVQQVVGLPRHRLRWRILTAIGLCSVATLSRRTRLGHTGSSWSKVHNSACSTAPSFRPAQKDGLEPSSRLRWLRANCMTSSSLTYIAG